MSFHEQHKQKFLAKHGGNGQAVNDAAGYAVRIAAAEVSAGAPYWKVVGVHHLTPEENGSRHHAFVDAVDENGQRVRDANLRIAWSWEGRQPDQAAPAPALDKPDNEPAGNVPIAGQDVNLEIWLEGDGLASERVQNMHTRHPDEPAANGELLNTKGHHSYYVVFQRARKGATPAVNGGQGQPATPPVTPVTPVTPQPASAGTGRPSFYPETIFGLHEQGGEGHMVNAGRPGWVLELAEVGLHGGQPANFTPLAQQGLGVVVRINHGYGSTGTLPTPDRYPQFAEACAAYVARSQGCHVWIIGNEPNHEQERPDGQPITPSDYVRAYKLCRSKIRSLSGHEQDHVLVAGPAPWNNQTKYDGNPGGDWGKYFADTLALLGEGECDGFAIHTYTRLHDPSRIQVDVPFNSPGYGHLRDEFRSYRDFMERIPSRFRHLPVLITETDPTEPTRGWEPANNLGWVKTAYREIADWNRNLSNQPIQALILYRWPVRADQPNWSISNRQGIIDDFNEALRAEPASDYQVRMAEAGSPVELPPERITTPLPPIYTNQQLIDALASASNALGLGSWALLEKAGLNLNQLAADREGLYTGAALEALPNLVAAERALIRTELLRQLSRRPRWQGVVNAQAGLMLRTGPGQNHAAVKGLPHETRVSVLSEHGPWLFVLADGDAGYVFAEFVIGEMAVTTTTTPVTTVVVAAETPMAPSAGQEISMPAGADWHTTAVVNAWNRYGGLLTALAGQLNIDPAIAVAVISIESSGRGFDGGRMTIRFEVHIFLSRCAPNRLAQARQHFFSDPSREWSDPWKHVWRRDPSADWQPVHTGRQESQWEVLDFARQIDPEAALLSISMGAAQIMGFNYQNLGYPSVQAMFEHFQANEQNQIAGLFRFMQVKGLVASVRNREFRAFAEVYNGSGQPDHYANLVKTRLSIFEALRPTVAAVPAEPGPVVPLPQAAAMAEPAPAPAAIALPDVGQAGTLKELDPELYKAWSDHIKQGFVNNNIMFNRVLEGFMRPYQTTIWMYRILFGIGVASFIASVVMAILMKDESPATAIGTTALFGGLSIVAFLSYFVSRPLQALEENLQFITWLGIVYNTYWTRLINTTDPASQHQELEDATNDAVNSIKEMLDKHAAHSRQRPGLTP